MGIHAERLAKHEAIMADHAKHQDKIRSAISECHNEAASLDEKANALSSRVIEGDRSAITQKAKFLDDKRLLGVRIADLQRESDGCDRQHDVDVRTRQELQLYAHIESLSNDLEPRLRGLSEEISAAIGPLASKVGVFSAEFNAATGDVLPVIEGRRDAASLRALRDKLQFCVINGLLNQLSGDFRKAGLDILKSSTQVANKFDASVAPVITALVGVMRAHLPPDPAQNIFSFRAQTNIGGLFFVSFTEGEILSLKADDPGVRRLIDAGALERVDDIAIAKGAS